MKMEVGPVCVWLLRDGPLLQTLLGISAVVLSHDFPVPPPDANAMTWGDFPRREA